MDTELLRGFLRGMFDGDGEVSGRTITLVFGTQYDFEPMCRDIQKALLFFGIRSRCYKYDYRYKITISTYDNSRFMEMIGFISQDKIDKANALETEQDNHVFNRCLTVESVEITDEYVDMYDVCNTEGGYYVADGLVTHNTAADIFKISVARNFSYIRENNLLGLFLIVNMIHDEQLMEVNANYLNIQKVLADVGKNMQFKVAGFPPLYIGAGVGTAWGKAKGKMAEIHPMLLARMTQEAESMSLWSYGNKGNNSDVCKNIYKYFDNRILEFRRQKVIDYLLDSNNYGKDLHPVIGGLLNLQFTYGHNKSVEGLNDDEFTKVCLEEFIKNNNLSGIQADWFVAGNYDSTADTNEDEDEDYDDVDGGEIEIDEVSENTFKIVDESGVIYGSSIQDMLNVFNFIISNKLKVCGINATRLSSDNKDKVVEYLFNHVCDDDADGALEVVFLQSGNILNRTGIYVNNIKDFSKLMDI